VALDPACYVFGPIWLGENRIECLTINWRGCGREQDARPWTVLANISGDPHSLGGGATYDPRDDVLEIATEGLDHLIHKPHAISVDDGHRRPHKHGDR
jgi:Family of unknown function (DUF5335)